jgi:Resolvase, N terminal domain
MIYGYARVSTDGQSVNAQVMQLREAGAEKVFRETASGARSDRTGSTRQGPVGDDLALCLRGSRSRRLLRGHPGTQVAGRNGPTRRLRQWLNPDRSSSLTTGRAGKCEMPSLLGKL